MSPTGAVSLPQGRSFGAIVERHRLAINLASFALVAILAAAYVIQVNRSAASGYDVRELQTRLGALTLENQNLEGDVQRAQALERVSHSVRMLGFVPAGTPTYVTSAAPSYALADTAR